MRAYLPLVSSAVAKKRYTSPTRATVQPCWGVRIIGFIRLVSSLFFGQCLHELRRPLDPAAHLLVALDTFQPDRHPSLHGPTSDVELLDMRLQQGQVVLVGAEPGDERILPDADEHVAVEQEADAAERPSQMRPHADWTGTSRETGPRVGRHLQQMVRRLGAAI